MNLIINELRRDKKQREKLPIAEVFFSSDVVRPGNIAITPEGRFFVSTNMQYESEIRVYELFPETQEYKPYPNAEYVSGENRQIRECIGIKVDTKNNLWMLDMVDPAFHVWDTNNEKLVERIPISEDVVKPNSFLQDFVVDEKHKRAIIADMCYPIEGYIQSSPAFIVVDLETHECKRVAENHESVTSDIKFGGGINPIDMDKDFEWGVFGPMIGGRMYRAKAELFGDEEKMIESITLIGNDKSICDGAIYYKDGIMFIGDVKNDVIGKLDNGTFTEWATMPAGQTWPDGFAIHNGYLYCTVNQLSKGQNFMTNTVDNSNPPYTVVRMKI